MTRIMWFMVTYERLYWIKLPHNASAHACTLVLTCIHVPLFIFTKCTAHTHADAHIHIHAHTCTHTCTHAYIYARMHAYLHGHLCLCMHTYIVNYTCTHILASNAQVYMCRCVYCMCMYVCVYARGCICECICMRVQLYILLSSSLYVGLWLAFSLLLLCKSKLNIFSISSCSYYLLSPLLKAIHN